MMPWLKLNSHAERDELVVLILDERLIVGDLAAGEVDAALGRDAHFVTGEVVFGADGVTAADGTVVKPV